MRTRVFIGIALAVAFAAYADQTTVAHHDDPDYVVWVDRLNLRAGPSAEADTVTTLERGDGVTYLGYEVEYADGFWWRRVRASECEGWVADCYIVTNEVYAAFENADERGKAGDAEGMVTAIDKGYTDLTGSIYGSPKPYCVSPNGEKVFADLPLGFAEARGYPDRSPYVPFPVLYFEARAGLKKCVTYELYDLGEWYGGDRYYVFTAIAPGDEWPLLPILRILDTDEWEEVEIGLCENHPGGESLFEFSGQYIIWLTQEGVPSGELLIPEFYEIRWKPALKAYEVGTGEIITVLESDTDTISKEPTGLAPCQGIYFFSVTLVPTGPAPDEVTDSDLYGRFNGGEASALTGR